VSSDERKRANQFKCACLLIIIGIEYAILFRSTIFLSDLLSDQIFPFLCRQGMSLYSQNKVRKTYLRQLPQNIYSRDFLIPQSNNQACVREEGFMRRKRKMDPQKAWDIKTWAPPNHLSSRPHQLVRVIHCQEKSMGSLSREGKGQSIIVK
jgi:hypothetical protein